MAIWRVSICKLDTDHSVDRRAPPHAHAALLVEGDDRPGLGAAMARSVAKAGVNIHFVMAETVGRKFSALFGFHSEADAALATKSAQRSGIDLIPDRSRGNSVVLRISAIEAACLSEERRLRPIDVRSGARD